MKNKIVFKDKVKNKIKVSEDLQLLTFQNPNNKLFYTFPLKLAIYNMANNDDKGITEFQNWVQTKLGEPPVVFKEPLIEATIKNMENYMFNLGYLHNNISSSVKIKKQKAVVSYIVEPNTQYKINKVIPPLIIDDISRLIAVNQKESLLKSKDYFNINTLDKERQRLTDILRDNGYYFFNKEYLRYDIDSLNKNKSLDLILKINPPTDEKGQIKFYINNVTIFTDFHIERRSDSLQLDTFEYNGYTFITENHNIKPKALLLGMFLKKGDKYSLEKHQKTQKKIVSFGSFKFVNFEYKLVDKNKLDVYIFLTPNKKQVLGTDVELSYNYSGLFGTAISGSYQNRNFSKRSDLLEFKASAGIELNLINNKDKSEPLINNTDINVELSYHLNRFIVPFPLKKVSKNSNVKTKFTLAYDFEDRIETFTKHATTFTAGYEWNETQTKKHFYNPVNISLLLIPKKDPSFIKLLEEKPYLTHSFEESIIFGSNYTFLMTNKKGENDNSFFKFKGDINLAGNFIHSAMLLGKKKSTDSIPYKIFGKEYSQFAKFEGNIVQHNKVSHHSELVTHFNFGIIIPYGNSKVAPYFQQFYAGGPNSLRAFRMRALGPGGYGDANDYDLYYFDQSGDIKIEGNIEYRFDLIWWFKWAFFVDAGNTWLLNKNVERPNGHFTKDFYKQIAVGFGTGLRMDFTYFVIRTDLAIPIIDPREEDTWRLNKINFNDKDWRKNNLIFSLAIGYPF